MVIKLRYPVTASVVLTLAVAGIAFGQTSDWPDPTAHDVEPYATAGLTHGPLLGGVTATSVKVWVRTREPGAFEVVYDERLPLTVSSSSVAGRTTEEADLTGVIELTGLKPDTRYVYGIRIGDALAEIRIDRDDAWPSFRTLPDRATRTDARYNPAGLFNVSFAIGHCASQDPFRSGGQFGSPPAFDSIYRRHVNEVMFAIVNGDVIYEEARDGTLDGVRRNYRLYFERGRSFQRLFRNVPGLFTFDDHDVGWDIHGSGQVGLGEGRHLIRDIGLHAYGEYLSWANYRGSQSGTIRFGEGELTAGSGLLFDLNASFDSLDSDTVSTIHIGPYTPGNNPRRVGATPRNAGVYGLARVVDDHRLEISPAAEYDESVPYSIGTHHYYDWRIANCHFFALDTRGERSDRNASDRTDPSLFILGEQQRQWLMRGIRETDAEFIFLISPDPWTIYHTAAHVSDAPGAEEDDKGDGFPSFLHERRLLLDFLDGCSQPVLIFTGDVHASACVRVTDNVWEMMCGPLGSTGHPRATLGNPPRGGSWTSKDQPVEIRWITGFPNNLPYQRIRNTYYGIVQVNNVLRVARVEGTGHQWVAYDQPQVVVRWHDGYTGRLVYAESIAATGTDTTGTGGPSRAGTGSD